MLPVKDFKVNNGNTLTMGITDKEVVFNLSNSKGEKLKKYVIGEGDMVTLLNWYVYQKENGNKELKF